MADTMITKAARIAGHPEHSRAFENVCAFGSFGLALIYVLGVEMLPSVLQAFGVAKCENISHPFPWVIVTLCAIGVVPKTLGRATGGKVWAAIASKFGA